MQSNRGACTLLSFSVRNGPVLEMARHQFDKVADHPEIALDEREWKFMPSVPSRFMPYPSVPDRQEFRHPTRGQSLRSHREGKSRHLLRSYRRQWHRYRRQAGAIPAGSGDRIRAGSVQLRSRAWATALRDKARHFRQVPSASP